MTNSDIQKMKLRLRKSGSTFDAEIGQDMQSAVLALARCGVDIVDSDTDIENELIFTAIEMYVKDKFNFEGDSETYAKRFTEMTKELALSTGYMVES